MEKTIPKVPKQIAILDKSRLYKRRRNQWIKLLKKFPGGKVYTTTDEMIQNLNGGEKDWVNVSLVLDYEIVSEGEKIVDDYAGGYHLYAYFENSLKCILQLDAWGSGENRFDWVKGTPYEKINSSEHQMLEMSWEAAYKRIAECINWEFSVANMVPPVPKEIVGQ
jgi:hypothetical protein